MENVSHAFQRAYHLAAYQNLNMPNLTNKQRKTYLTKCITQDEISSFGINDYDICDDIFY